MLAALLSFIGSITAFAGTSACGWLFIDEPEMPEDLIK